MYFNNGANEKKVYVEEGMEESSKDILKEGNRFEDLTHDKVIW